MDHLKSNGEEGNVPDHQQARSNGGVVDESVDDSEDGTTQETSTSQTLETEAETDLVRKLEAASLMDKESGATTSSNEVLAQSVLTTASQDKEMKNALTETLDVVNASELNGETPQTPDNKSSMENQPCQEVSALDSGSDVRPAVLANSKESVERLNVIDELEKKWEAKPSSSEVGEQSTSAAASQNEDIKNVLKHVIDSITIAVDVPAIKDADTTRLQAGIVNASGALNVKTFELEKGAVQTPDEGSPMDNRTCQESSSNTNWDTDTFPSNESEKDFVQVEDSGPLEVASDPDSDEEEVDERILAAQQALRDESNSEFSTDDEGPDPCITIRIPDRTQAREPSPPSRVESAPREESGSSQSSENSSDGDNDEEEVDVPILTAQQALRDGSNSEFTTDDEGPDPCITIRIPDRTQAREPSPPSRVENAPREESGSSLSSENSSDGDNDEEEVDAPILAAQQALRDESNSEFSTDDEGPDPCITIRIPDRTQVREPSPPSRVESAPRESSGSSSSSGNSSDADNDEEKVDARILAAQQALRDESNSEFSTDDEGPDPYIAIRIPDRNRKPSPPRGVENAPREDSRSPSESEYSSDTNSEGEEENEQVQNTQMEKNAPQEAQILVPDSARPDIVEPLPMSPTEDLHFPPSKVEWDREDEEYYERAVIHVKNFAVEYNQSKGSGKTAQKDGPVKRQREKMETIVEEARQDEDQSSLATDGFRRENYHAINLERAPPNTEWDREDEEYHDRAVNHVKNFVVDYNQKEISEENIQNGELVEQQQEKKETILKCEEESFSKTQDVKVPEKKPDRLGESSNTTEEVTRHEDQPRFTIDGFLIEDYSKINVSRDWAALAKLASKRVEPAKDDPKNHENRRDSDESSVSGNDPIRSSDSEDDNSNASSVRCRAGSSLCGEISPFLDEVRVGREWQHVVRDDGRYSTQHRLAPATSGFSNEKPRFVKGADYWREYFHGRKRHPQKQESTVKPPSNEKVESEEELRARKAEENRLNEEYIKTLDANSLKADTMARCYNQQQVWREQEQRASAWKHQPTQQHQPQQNLQHHPAPRFNSSQNNSQPPHQTYGGHGTGFNGGEQRQQYQTSGNDSYQYDIRPQQSYYGAPSQPHRRHGFPEDQFNRGEQRQQYQNSGYGSQQYDMRPHQSSSAYGGPPQSHQQYGSSDHGYNGGNSRQRYDNRLSPNTSIYNGPPQSHQPHGLTEYGYNGWDQRQPQSSSVYNGPPQSHQSYGSSEFEYNGRDQRQPRQSPSFGGHPSRQQHQYAPPQQQQQAPSRCGYQNHPSSSHQSYAAPSEYGFNPSNQPCSSNQKEGYQNERRGGQGGWDAPRVSNDGGRGSYGDDGFAPRNAQPQYRPQQRAPSFDESDENMVDDFGEPIQRRRRFEAGDFEPILCLEEYDTVEEIKTKFLKFVTANEFAAIPTLNSQLRTRPNYMFGGFNPIIFVQKHMSDVIKIEYIMHDAEFKLA